MNRRATVVGSAIAALLIAGTAACAVLDRERKDVDPAARAAAPGRFVRLRDGVTQYELVGSDTARTIVLLSGMSVPFYLWDCTADALAAAGLRVLRYNYYGRGFSDRPSLTYDLATCDRQLTELLDTLRIRGPIDVAGVSMGGVVAANFAESHADRVRSLTLVDPGALAAACERCTPRNRASATVGA